MKENMLEIKDIAPYLNNDIQNLIIFPTEQCNFRCYYCYENYQNGRMSLETIYSVKKLLDMKAPYLRLLIISWFGGEPLIASDIVLEISKYAFDLSKKYNFIFKSNITTNGYELTSNLFFNLCKSGISTYQISLDGPQKVHDKTRVLSNGKGSFDKIWNNIKKIHNSNENVIVILRIHIDEDKLPYIYELIDRINLELKGDNRFKVFFKAISTLGGANDSKLKIIPSKKMWDIINDFNAMLYNENIYFNSVTSCYASHPNSLIVRSTGEISKCTVALNDSKNNIGRINLDGTLTIDNMKLQNWVVGLLNRDKEVALCPYKKQIIEKDVL